MKVTIIGSGLAGVAACDRLMKAGAEPTIYEAEEYWGGHTHTEVVEGFVFDEGPHVSFTTDDQVRETFLSGAGAVEEFQASISNYFAGHWLTHPVQCHLYGLDSGLVTRCIVDFIQAQGSSRVGETYADWLLATYGATFAETFPSAYTRKYWTVDPSLLTTEWIGPRMYPPKLEEVIRGALSPSFDGEFHYLRGFRYPASGGYQAFMAGMAHPEHIVLGKRLVELDPMARWIRFSDGSELTYEHLISTMPLPDLVRAIPVDKVPAQVRAAADALLCTSVVLVDLAVARPDLSPHHWFYVYDDDVSYSRVHFPHRLAPRNAPEGRGSIQAEIYFSAHRPLPSAAGGLVERTVDELIAMHILSSPADVLWGRQRTVPFANVVFDHQRASALGVIRPWVEQHGITLAGRYGEWGYHWTDDATRSGWSAADQILIADAVVG